MKKNSWTVIAALTAGLLLPVTEARATAPTVITNVTQLLQINNDRAGSYTLGASFTLSSTPDGTSTYITDLFTGTFNGNGFTLSGLTGSLFSEIQGSVSNLNLVTVVGGITTYGVAPYCHAGVLAGQLQSGVIDGVEVSGAITTDGDCGATGGLIGSASSRATILNSSSSVNVNSNDPSVGGLVGRNGASITNSRSSGIVHGRYETGGFVGTAVGGLIDASFSTATVSGGEHTGGLIGGTGGSVTVSRSATSGLLGSLIGYKASDDGDGNNFVVEVTDVGGSDSRTVTNTEEWGLNQYINSGVQYIKALKASGFYTDTTPPPPAITEEQAKAAAAVAAAKREAEVKTARVNISNKLAKSEKLTIESFKQAEIAGVNASNFTEVQSEILALPEAARSDIKEVLKIARKFEVIGKISSEQITTLPVSVFIEVGLIPADSKNKSALMRAVQKVSSNSRDSYAEVMAVIAAEAAVIQARRDKLATLKERIASRQRERQK